MNETIPAATSMEDRMTSLAADHKRDHGAMDHQLEKLAEHENEIKFIRGQLYSSDELLTNRCDRIEARLDFIEHYLNEINLRLHYAQIDPLPENECPHRGLPRHPYERPVPEWGTNPIEGPKRESHHIDPVTGEAVQT